MSEEIKEQSDSEKLDEILKISRDIKKYMYWQNIWAIVRILVIVIPIIIGFIYLPPLLRDSFQSYSSLLKGQ
jgi:hypothetical protein